MTENIFVQRVHLARTNLKPQRSSCLMFSVVVHDQCLIETYIILHFGDFCTFLCGVYHLHVDVSSGGCLLQ